jgi:hypothetical protein
MHIIEFNPEYRNRTCFFVVKIVTRRIQRVWSLCTAAFLARRLVDVTGVSSL